MNEPISEVKTHVQGDKKLGYNTEFRQMLRKHPGIIKTAMQLSKKAEDDYSPQDSLWGVVPMHWDREKKRWYEVREVDPADDTPDIPIQHSSQRGIMLKPGENQIDPVTGLEVTLLGTSDREWRPAPRHVSRIDKSSYFKMSLGENAFFVKKSTATTNPGFDEFSNTLRASEALKGLADYVEVVEMQLGYQDNQQSWYISKWRDDLVNLVATTDVGTLDPITDYGEIIPNDEFFLENKEYEAIANAKNMIRTKLEEAGMDIHDLNSNLFYNQKTKKWVLLDVTVGDSSRLNQ